MGGRTINIEITAMVELVIAEGITDKRAIEDLIQNHEIKLKTSHRLSFVQKINLGDVKQYEIIETKDEDGNYTGWYRKEM
jgi:5S rRNA maturation endonuclease (ribonuclease M5)